MEAKGQTFKPHHSQRPTLGYLTSHIAQDWAAQPWRGAIDASREHNVNLICLQIGPLRCPDLDQARANVLCDLIDPENIQGLVIWSTVVGAFLSEKETGDFCDRYGRHIPIVTLESEVGTYPHVPIDDYGGMYAAVSHLIETHAYRRIAFINLHEKHIGFQQRYRAYREALAGHDLPIDPQLVLPSLPVEKPLRATLDEWLPGVMDAGVDAIVCVTDSLAIKCMESFQARGIRIPEDVAVIGFDNVAEGRAVSPALTTVHGPFYEMGKQGVETVLALIDGATDLVPSPVPAPLIVRRSCGCFEESVKQAALDPIELLTGASPRSADLTAHRDAVITEIRQAMICSEDMITPVIDAFMSDVEGVTHGTFITALEAMLQTAKDTGQDVALCQNAISILCRRLVPDLDERTVLIRAIGLWQQARIIISDAVQHRQASQTLQTEVRMGTLRRIGGQLITSFDVEALIQTLAKNLPNLNIPGCYLSLYDWPQSSETHSGTAEWSRMILAYNQRHTEYQHGCAALPVQGQRFLSRRFVPQEFLPPQGAYQMVIEPLYFQDDQIGFAVFELGPQDGKMYDALRQEISSALQGALLVRRVHERSAALARQKYILDMFMANVPDSIYFKDRESRFTNINPALAGLLGLKSPADALGKTDFDFFPESEARPKYAEEQEILRTGKPILNVEEPDAQGRWSLTTKMPLRDEHGGVIGTFGISRDITVLKQAQKALEQAYSEISVLNCQLREENVRMGAELDVARRLQQMVLPTSQELRDIQGLDIVGFSQPADEVGGDYYDVLATDGLLHVGIGDVTGHGLESGVLMLMTQTAIRTLIEYGETDPVVFVNTLNRAMYKNIQRMGADRTLTFALIKYRDGQVNIVGQHEEVLVVRKDGVVERMDTINLGFPIGLEQTIDQWVASATIFLEPGDGVVLYTDGITEAANTAGELYGLERLCAVVRCHWHASAEETKQAVIDDVLRHVGAQSIFDDLTLVIMKQQ